MSQRFANKTSCLLGVAAALGLAAGCSLYNDYDLEQCERDADCARRGRADFICQDNLCSAFDCSSDAECSARPGFEGTICEEQVCTTPRCSDDAACRSELDSPTASCVEGRCADPEWGCIDGARPPPSPPTLRFTATVQDVSTGLVATDMLARACLRADHGCTSPLAAPVGATDSAGNVSFSITGLGSNGFDGFVKFTSPAVRALEVYFITPMTRNFTYPPAMPIGMLPPGRMTTLASAAERSVNEATTGLFVLQTFDCEGQPAAGVTLTAIDGDGSFFFATDETYVHDVEATASAENGMAGLAGLPAQTVTINVIHQASGHMLHSFPLRVHESTLHFGLLYAADL
jgi:hypothetical protein